MTVIHCNLQGQKHTKRNQPCEDGICFLRENGVMVFSVADGAGSAKYPNAKQGADTTSNTICRFFAKKFDEFFDVCNEMEMRKIIAAVCVNSLKLQAQKLGLDSFSTMASTLLAVAVKDDRAIACQIGDGLVGVKKKNELEPVFLPQSGEFASTTFFITNENAYQFIQVRKFFVHSISHFFLMSDGVADYVYDERNGRFEPVMDRLLEFTKLDDGSEILSQCIESNIVNQNELSDDCSIIIASLSNEVGESEEEVTIDLTAAGRSKEERTTASGETAKDEIESSSDEKDQKAKMNNPLPCDQMIKTENTKWPFLLIAILFILTFILGFALGKGRSNKLKDGTTKNIATQTQLDELLSSRYNKVSDSSTDTKNESGTESTVNATARADSATGEVDRTTFEAETEEREQKELSKASAKQEMNERRQARGS